MTRNQRATLLLAAGLAAGCTGQQAAERGELLPPPPAEVVALPAPALIEDSALWIRATPIALPVFAALAEGAAGPLATADDGFPPADPDSPAEDSVADELAAIFDLAEATADGANGTASDPGALEARSAELAIAEASPPDSATAETATLAAEAAQAAEETATAETTTAETPDADSADAATALAEPEPLRQWPVAPERQRSLRETLAEWAALAEWQLDWRAGPRDWRPTAAADFAAATLPEAVAALLSTPELGGRLRADAYPLNRWLVVREAGP